MIYRDRLRLWMLGLLLGTFVARAQQDENGSGLDVATVQEFQNLDRDRNGQLDAREFAFSQIAERFDAADKSADLPGVFAEIDHNHSGGIELLELSKAQQNRNVRLLDKESGQNFIQSDLDHNGLIGFEEYLQRPGANAGIFKRIDLNQSKQVGPFEWMHALTKEMADKDVALHFARQDKNDDGAISREEFKTDPPKSIANAFDAIDLNGNGELGPEEFLKAVSQAPDEIDIPKEVTRHFEEIDRNRDRVLSLREFVRHLPPQPPPNAAGFQPPPPEKLFEDMDVNQDGEVTLIEFYQRRFTNGFPQNAAR